MKIFEDAIVQHLSVVHIIRTSQKGKQFQNLMFRINSRMTSTRTITTMLQNHQKSLCWTRGFPPTFFPASDHPWFVVGLGLLPHDPPPPWQWKPQGGDSGRSSKLLVLSSLPRGKAISDQDHTPFRSSSGFSIWWNTSIWQQRVPQQ